MPDSTWKFTARPAMEAEKVAALRKEWEAEAKEEADKATPSSHERALCREMLRELEVECRVLSLTASTMADRAEKKRAERRSNSLAGAFFLLLAFGPLLLATQSVVWLFWLSLIIWVVIFITVLVVMFIDLEALDKLRSTCREVSKGYRELALRTRVDQKIKVPTVTRRDDLNCLPSNIRSSMENFRDFMPSQVDINAARHQVELLLNDKVRVETLPPPPPILTPPSQIGGVRPMENLTAEDLAVLEAGLKKLGEDGAF